MLILNTRKVGWVEVLNKSRYKNISHWFHVPKWPATVGINLNMVEPSQPPGSAGPNTGSKGFSLATAKASVTDLKGPGSYRL